MRVVMLTAVSRLRASPPTSVMMATQKTTTTEG